MSDFMVTCKGETESALHLMIDTLDGIRTAYYSGSFPDSAVWEDASASGTTVRVVMS